MVLFSPRPVLVDEEDDGPGLGPRHQLGHDLVKVLALGVARDLGTDGHADALPPRELLEGGDTLLAVLALGGHGGDVGPAHDLGDLDHGLGLEVVGRDDAGEELEAGLVRQLGRGRRVADLGHLGK